MTATRLPTKVGPVGGEEQELLLSPSASQQLPTATPPPSSCLRVRAAGQPGSPTHPSVPGGGHFIHCLPFLQPGSSPGASSSPRPTCC